MVSPAPLHNEHSDQEKNFKLLFDRHWTPLVAYAERLGAESRAAARDIVQDVFLNIWERRNTLVISGETKAYLYAAVRSRVLNEARHARVIKKAETLVDDIPPGMSHPQPSAEAALIGDELSQALVQALSTLPERTREVTLLRWYDQLSYAEIAQVLGISHRTVNAHLTTAMSALRQRLRHLI